MGLLGGVLLRAFFFGHLAEENAGFADTTYIFALAELLDLSAVAFHGCAVSLEAELNEPVFDQCSLNLIQNCERQALFADVHMRFEALSDAAELFLFGA